MPATYAHYRFGMEQFKTMDADVQKTVARFRQLFDVGLHGPDLFFYYNPVFKTQIGRLGRKFHRQSGREFFERACRALRSEPTEAGVSYLYGVLCHYALDSVCHPYIVEKSREGTLLHSEIETEFDRFLLETDGKTPVRWQDVCSHIRLTAGESETVSKFYPGTTGSHIRTSTRNVALLNRLLIAPEGMKHIIVKKGASALGKSIGAMVMTNVANQRCAGTNEKLLALYGIASHRTPILLEQIKNHLCGNAPLGDWFEADFG